MRIRRFRMLAGVVALGFAFTLALGSTGTLGGGSALGAATTLTIISGDVTVRHGATGTFTGAKDGDLIAAGDTIHTGADARAVLTYFEGSTVTVEPNTLLVVDTASPLAGGGTLVQMTQLVGRTWHVVTKLATSTSRYEVRTPSSTASVRGTEFQVDSDPDTTTVTTTEGTVVAEVADPVPGGRTVEVPVTAGNMQKQTHNARPAPAQPAPQAKRTVTVTVGAASSLIVDPFGRANGVTKDGKLVAQTPGARVRRDGDSVVVDLPDMPDGRIGASVDGRGAEDDRSDGGATTIRATIRERSHTVDLADGAKPGAGGRTTGFEIHRGSDGTTEGRVLDDEETAALPQAKVTESGHAVPRTRTGSTPRPLGIVPSGDLPELPVALVAKRPKTGSDHERDDTPATPRPDRTRRP